MVKRFLFIAVVLVCIVFNTVLVSAEGVTLSQIADSFNNCEAVKTYKEYDYTWNAEVKENKLVITLSNTESTTSAEYILDDNILTSSSSSETQEDSFTWALTTSVLVDSIGQIHGYRDGELFDTINSEKITSYTVDNEGFELVEKEDGSLEVKIDINKKMPLADFSDVYIKTSDIDEFAVDLLNSDEPGSFFASKNPISYKLEKYDELVIYMSEKEGLTDRAYKSILSFVDVIFNSEKATEYFKNNYSDISVGDKKFDGFEIALNIQEEDMPYFGDNYVMMKVVIDKDIVDKTINSEKVIDKYTDVNANDWFYDDVNYVVTTGLFNGISENKFDPNSSLTRGMLVTVLYRLAGATDQELSSFDDVDSTKYYSAPIAWANKNGYVNGIGGNKFNPDKQITREDLATIIYRYLKAQGRGFTDNWMFLLEYNDKDKISEYAYEPICWLTMNDILSGKENKMIDPKGLATRAETSKIIRKIVLY